MSGAREEHGAAGRPRRTAPAPRVAAAVAALALLAIACAGTVPEPAAPTPEADRASADGAPDDRPAQEQRSEEPPPPLAPQAPLPPARDAVPEPRPSERPRRPRGPLELRVGLASDLESVGLPCCEAGLSVDLGGHTLALSAASSVRPGAGVERRLVYRLQAAALKDSGQAERLARELGERLKQPAEAHFDAGIDLYRVRAGRYATREEAERARTTLRMKGDSDAWVVTEGGSPGNPSLTLMEGPVEHTIPGRWLVVTRAGDEGIRYGGVRYRGKLLIYLNDRGSLNVINELRLEEYLRGVVPKELGPAAYPQLEALKAQAVAARTYTLRNLGEFALEGYDICGTPRCQVYGGMEVEHRLSDRAIAETAGQVLLWKGELIDSLYSSTCGGHTENGGVMFPEKDFEYLRGVPCIEAGAAHLAGRLQPGTPLPRGLMRALLPPAGGLSPVGRLEERLSRLAAEAGLPQTRDRLASIQRHEVQRYVASVFDLALDARLFVAEADVDYLLGHPPADWTGEDRRRASLLAGSGLFEGALERTIEGDDAERLLWALARLLGVVREEPARFVGLETGILTFADADGHRRSTGLGEAHTFLRRGETAIAAALTLTAGDRLRLYRAGERLLGVLYEGGEGPATAARSRMSSWRRYRSHRELAARVEERYPGLGFSGFRILERGVSGRVGKVEILGDRDEKVEVVGLAVRWTFDVPDNQFTAQRVSRPESRGGWQFSGRGWGHGVGMCQIGAYSMARRGLGYRDILSHYYTGVQLARVRQPVTQQAP